MKKQIAFLLALVLMLALAGCDTNDDEAVFSSDNSSAQSSDTEPTLSLITDNTPVGELVRYFRDAEWKTIGVRSDVADANPGKGYRVTAEWVEAITEVILINERVEVSRDDLYAIDMMPEAFLAVDVRPVSDGVLDYTQFEIWRFPKDYELLEFADKSMLLIPMAYELPCYLYDGAVFDEIAALAEGSLYDYSDVATGDFISVVGGFTEDASVNTGSLQIIDILDLGDTVIMSWWKQDDKGAFGIDFVDTKTGEIFYSERMESGILSLEMTNRKDYRFRAILADRIIYWNADASQKDIYTPTLPQPSAEWDVSATFMFDVDMDANLLAYAGIDGIYLANLDGSNSRVVLKNSLLPELVKDNTELKERNYAPNQLIYARPLLMNNGKQLVASIYLNSDGNYDGTFQGVSRMDLTTDEIKHRPGGFVWLSGGAARLGEGSISFWSSEDDIDGIAVLDAATLEKTQVLKRYLDDFDRNIWLTADHTGYLGVEETRTDAGELLQKLWYYPLEETKNAFLLLEIEGRNLSGTSNGDWVVAQYGSDYDRMPQFVMIKK